jgi:hypothetical protein
MPCAFKWLNRRGGKRRSFSWGRFTQILDANHIERPRMTEVRRRRVFACAHVLRGSQSNRGTGCGNTARPGLCGGAPGNRRPYRGGRYWV